MMFIRSMMMWLMTGKTDDIMHVDIDDCASSDTWNGGYGWDEAKSSDPRL